MSASCTISVGNISGSQHIAPSSLGLDFWESAEGRQWTCSYFDAEPAVLQVEDAGQRVTLPFLLRHLPGGLKLASVYPYCGPDGVSEALWNNIPAVSTALRSNGILRLEIPCVGDDLHHVRPCADNWRLPALDAVRQVIDLPADGRIEELLHPNIRWASRKASRVGVAVREARPDDASAMQAIYAETMRAKQAPVNYGVTRWTGLLETLVPSGMAKACIAELDGCPIGMAACVDGAASRHLVQLAVLPNQQPTRAGEALVLSLLADASRKRLSFFDFMASSAGDHGLIAFKSKWGGKTESIRHLAIPGVPLLHRLVDLGRWYMRRSARG